MIGRSTEGTRHELLIENKDISNQLRDIFTPLCEKALSVVESFTDEQLRDMSDTLEHKPIMAPPHYALINRSENKSTIEHAGLTESEKYARMLEFKFQILFKDLVPKRDDKSEDQAFKKARSEELFHKKIPDGDAWQPYWQSFISEQRRHLIDSGLDAYIQEAIAAGIFTDESAKNFREYLDLEMKILAKDIDKLYQTTEIKSYLETLTMEERKAFARLLKQIIYNYTERGARKVDSISKETGYGYVWNENETTDSGVVADVMIPVGPYGEQFAQDLFVTTQVMLKLTGEELYDDAQKIEKENRQIIGRETARGRDTKLSRGRLPGPLATLQEGIISYAHALVQCSAEKVPGYENPALLLEAIIEQDLPIRIGRFIPMGELGPITIGGRYIPGLIQVKEDGKLGLSRTAVEGFVARKKDQLDLMHKGHVGGVHGLGCPVSRKGDGIKKSGNTMLGEAFWKIYKSIAHSSSRQKMA